MPKAAPFKPHLHVHMCIHAHTCPHACCVQPKRNLEALMTRGQGGSTSFGFGSAADGAPGAGMSLDDVMAKRMKRPQADSAASAEGKTAGDAAAEGKPAGNVVAEGKAAIDMATEGKPADPEGA